MFCANRHRCRCLEAASRDLIRMLMRVGVAVRIAIGNITLLEDSCNPLSFIDLNSYLLLKVGPFRRFLVPFPSYFANGTWEFPVR